MKKQLLALSMVMSGFGLFSQSTVWNPHNSNLDTTSGIRWMSVVNANTVWAVKSDGTHPTAVSNKFTRTQDGSTFTAGTFLPDTLYYSSASIKAVNDSVAYIPCYSKDATRNGIIMKTTDRGLTWTNVVDTIGTSMFVGPNNFPDWCHFWNENDGIALGDPNGNTSGTGTEFEIWTTANGGGTWTRVPDANIPNIVGSEYGLTDSYFAYGSKFLWFGTAHAASAVNHVYRSSDKGLTWLSSTVPGMNGGVSGLAFRDSLNGMCWGQTASTGGKLLVKRTTDGGITWSTVFQRNKVGQYDICVVPGRNAYMSVGLDSVSIAMGGVVGNGIHTSVTYDDGDTWTDLESAPGGAGANAFVMLKVSMVDSAHGWGGSFSDNTNVPFGTGGMNNWMGPVISKACPLNISGSTTICNGNSATLTANAGASSYTWTPGPVNTNTISVSPNATTIYTVNSADAGGCTNSKTYTLNVTATPTVSVTSSVVNDTIYNVNCASSPTVTTLNAVGAATSYSWAPTAGITGTGASVAAHPTVTTTYTLTGHTGTCIGTSTITVVSINCTSVSQLTVNGTGVSVYPNPSNGQITVSLTNVKAGTVLAVSDLLGNEVYKNTLNSYNMSQTMSIDLSSLPKGVYLFGVSNGNQSKVQKLVIQ